MLLVADRWLQLAAALPGVKAALVLADSAATVPAYLAVEGQEHLFTALISSTLLLGLVFALIAILVTVREAELVRRVLNMNVSPFRFPLPFGHVLWFWMVACALLLGLSFTSLFWPSLGMDFESLYNLTFEICVIGSLCVILLVAPRLIVHLQRRDGRLAIPPSGSGGTGQPVNSPGTIATRP